MNAKVPDAIPGRAPQTQAQAYGEWPLHALRAEVKKHVRYTVHGVA